MDTSPSATRLPKQARAIRTRERILDQAERAFAAMGFETASLTSDILEPAGISVGSFYHQFDDKRAVLHALLEERRSWTELHTRLLALTAQASTFDAAIRTALLAMFDAIDEHPDSWCIHFRELHSADDDVRRLIERSWATWGATVDAIVERWIPDPAHRSPGRMSFVSLGLSGILRRYLVADRVARSRLRGAELDEVSAACAAALER